MFNEIYKFSKLHQYFDGLYRETRIVDYSNLIYLMNLSVQLQFFNVGTLTRYRLLMTNSLICMEHSLHEN